MQNLTLTTKQTPHFNQKSAVLKVSLDLSSSNGLNALTLFKKMPPK